MRGGLSGMGGYSYVGVISGVDMGNGWEGGGVEWEKRVAGRVGTIVN